MFFLGLDDPAIIIERVRRRGLTGGHAAREIELRAIFAASLANLGVALREWDVVHCYDASVHGRGPRRVATARSGALTAEVGELPSWIQRAWASP